MLCLSFDAFVENKTYLTHIFTPTQAAFFALFAKRSAWKIRKNVV